MKDLGLCADCISAGECFIAVSFKKPVLYCDEHEGRSPRHSGRNGKNGAGAGRKGKATAGRVLAKPAQGELRSPRVLARATGRK